MELSTSMYSQWHDVASMYAAIALCLVKVLMWPACMQLSLSLLSQGYDVASCFKFSIWMSSSWITELRTGNIAREKKKSKNTEQNNTKNLSFWNCVVRVYYHCSRRRNQEKKLKRNERKTILWLQIHYFYFSLDICSSFFCCCCC